MITDQPNGIPHREIMLIGSNASDLGFLSNALKTAGYRVRSATDGRSALRTIHLNLPDLILLDIRLPDMSGIEVCHEFKADAEAREIPVVFISAKEESHLKESALKAGGVDCLTKPIDASELLVRIENHLAVYRLRQKLALQSEQLRAEIEERKLAEKELHKHRVHLEEWAAERTATLKESESRFRAAFMGTSNAITISTRKDGVWIDVNQSTLDMFGYSREEAIGSSPFMTNLWVDLKDREKLIAALDRGEAVRKQEFRLRRKNGELIMASLSISKFEFKGVEHLLFNTEDITDRVKAEQNYQMLFREMIDGFALHEIICDDKGEVVDYRFLAVNPAFERLTGLSGEPLIGKTVLEVMPQTESHWIQKYGRVATTGEPETFDGYSRELGRHFQVRAFRVAAGQFACIFVDITDKNRADENLKKLQMQLSNAVEIAHLGHWEYDVGSDTFTFNDHFYHIFRTTAEAVGGYKMSSAEYAERFVHPDDRFVVEREILKAIAATDPGFKGRLEHRIVYADGSIGHITVMFFLVKDAQGNTVKTYGVNQDITELKQNEMRLQEAQKMESIGNLAGGIAHDFNNILFPIIGLSEVIMEDLPLDSIQRENMQQVLKSAERGRDLVQQILAFSRQSEHQMVPLRFQQILKEALKLMRATIPANIEIFQDIQSDCGLIRADATKLHQVAMNLMTNAYHAVEQTAGKISVHLAEVMAEGSMGIALKAGPYARLSISDSGCGIDSEVMDKIFEPYFTTKKKGKGTGLGLAVVYGIVRGHGGDIKVYSEVGVGSTFNVYLPLMKKSFKRKSTAKMEKLQGGTERILLVDDEQPVIFLLEQVLKRLGYRVTSFVSSADAFNFFRTDPNGFDLLITDMAMPHMTGGDLVRKILSIRADIPAILCTGFSERISREKAEAIGIKAFLMKPVARPEMARTVRRVLDNP